MRVIRKGFDVQMIDVASDQASNGIFDAQAKFFGQALDESRSYAKVSQWRSNHRSTFSSIPNSIGEVGACPSPPPGSSLSRQCPWFQHIPATFIPLMDPCNFDQVSDCFEFRISRDQSRGMVDRAGRGKTIGIRKGILGLEFGGLKNKQISDG
jgi:hypothetical protein